MGKRETEQRIKAVELHKKGFSRRQIAELLGVSPAEVKTWISMYRNRQEDLLVDRSCGKAYSHGLLNWSQCRRICATGGFCRK